MKWLKEAWGQTWGMWVVMLIGLVIGMDAHGYELPENVRKWNVSSINVYVKDGCPFPTDGLWGRAAHKWDVVDVVDKGKNGYVGYDYKSTLYCAEEDAALTLLPPGVEMVEDFVTDGSGYFVIASAKSYFIGGAMIEVDIRLHPVWVGNRNVEAVLLHEWGHGLGIIHSNNRNSLMYRVVPNKTSLHVDDYLAVCELYERCRSMDNYGNLSVKNIEFDKKCYDVIIPWGWDWKNESALEMTECK